MDEMRIYIWHLFGRRTVRQNKRCQLRNGSQRGGEVNITVTSRWNSVIQPTVEPVKVVVLSEPLQFLLQRANCNGRDIEIGQTFPFDCLYQCLRFPVGLRVVGGSQFVVD